MGILKKHLLLIKNKSNFNQIVKTAWNNLGNILLKQYKRNEAIEAYRKQIEINPKHKQAWNNLGKSFIGTG